MRKRTQETDESLVALSDSEIVQNFVRGITALYPTLIPIRAYGYDGWDDIVERLWFEMVYQTFAWKYGVSIPWDQHHRYGFAFHAHKGFHHVRCVPKLQPLPVLREGDETTLEEIVDEAKETRTTGNDKLVLISFGNGIHSTDNLSEDEAYDFQFSHTEIDIVSHTGLQRLDSSSDKEMIAVPNVHLDYEFIGGDS